jgi:hypothetical protein
MKLIKALVAGAALASVAGLAILADQTTTSSGSAMVAAAQKFLGTLSAQQKLKATYPFDDKERTTWHFTPQQDNKTRTATRKGVPLEDMNAAQKKAALDLVRSGTSQAGAVAATTIMSLEAILRETEKGGAMIRNPEWYFFTIFGEPSKMGKWGWRVEGHHLSLNFTMDGDQVIASTPAFFGANPAEIKEGDKKGHRTLAPSEDLARQLFKSLDDEQRKVAFQAKHFGEPGEKTLTPKVGAPVGLPASKMNAEQKETLTKLLKAYTDRMPADVGAVEYKAATAAGLDGIHSAYSGSTELGQGRTYRVQGATFVVEFLNTQPDGSKNAANHIHSCWRRLKGDFGL